MSVIEYRDVLAMVESGRLVACAPTVHADGKPGLAWLTVALDARGRAIATTGDGEPKVPETGIDDDDEIRAVQGLTFTAYLRLHTRRTGHKPA